MWKTKTNPAHNSGLFGAKKMAIQLPNPGLGDGQTGDNEYVMWTKVKDNFADQSNAASRLVGEENGRIPLYEHIPKVTSELGGSNKLAVSQKLLTDLLTPRINDIGTAGEMGFGVGITDNLPSGMSEIMGTTIKGHENYGNYQFSDGSVMCYVPKFYYRWGHRDSPNFAKHGANALDVKSASAFASESAANSAGYALHRAFYDGGEIKQGFFVDKFQCSNNSGVASSIKFAVPMSTGSANNPISGLTGSIANNLGGTIDAAKTRGQDFFPTTIFIQKALALLSLAHAQASTSTATCAWYDASGVSNFPKGNNNNALRDANDTTVEYEDAKYPNMGKTGSGVPFAKTTHNGQANGVADLNGNLNEVSLGLTVDADKFYVLKTSAEAKSLTSGATLATDAWGTAGVTANYDLVGDSYGEMTGVSRNFAIGSTTNPVFTNAKSGTNWAMDGAGIPMTGGGEGTNAFGNDRFYDNKVNALCPRSGGHWNTGSDAGVWYLSLIYSRSSSNGSIGFRSALYPV